MPGASYDEVLVAVPDGVNIAAFRIAPNVDWDAWVCGLNGMRLRLWNGEDAPEPCDGLLGSSDLSGLGCPEHGYLPVSPGETYLFRASMWADVSDCPWDVRFLKIDWS